MLIQLSFDKHDEALNILGGLVGPVMGQFVYGGMWVRCGVQFFFIEQPLGLGFTPTSLSLPLPPSLSLSLLLSLSAVSPWLGSFTPLRLSLFNACNQTPAAPLLTGNQYTMPVKSIIGPLLYAIRGGTNLLAFPAFPGLWGEVCVGCMRRWCNWLVSAYLISGVSVKVLMALVFSSSFPPMTLFALCLHRCLSYSISLFLSLSPSPSLWLVLE